MARTRYVENPRFEEYRERFAEHFAMERRDGVILLRLHTKGDPVLWSWEVHRAIGQAFRTVGSDPENEVMILTSEGDRWIAARDDTSFEGEETHPEYCSYEYMYTDGRRMVTSLVNEVEIPTLGVVPGPGFHMELPLMCDLTICSEDALFGDFHFGAGWVPGDGIHCALIELLGVKRAAWAMLMNEPLDARRALDLGLVNEVRPREALEERAWEIAARLMSAERITRRMSVQVLRRPWKRRIVDDLDVGWAQEMWAYLADRPSHRAPASRAPRGMLSEDDD